jgi:hypothetical protein
VDAQGEQDPAREDDQPARPLLDLDASGGPDAHDRRRRRDREPGDRDQSAREDQTPWCEPAQGQLSCSARRKMSRVASSSFCSAAIAVDVC